LSGGAAYNAALNRNETSAMFTVGLQPSERSLCPLPRDLSPKKILAFDSEIFKFLIL